MGHFVQFLDWDHAMVWVIGSIVDNIGLWQHGRILFGGLTVDVKSVIGTNCSEK